MSDEQIRQKADEIVEVLEKHLNEDGTYRNRKEKRPVTLAMRKLLKKHGIHIPNPDLITMDSVKMFIEEEFDGTGIESKEGVRITISFLIDANQDSQIDLQPRSYQREKVASLEWKQEIMRTVIIDNHYKIPAIHIRILRDETTNEIIGYEIADGQQRVSAILDFINGKFRLPKDFQVGSFNLGGMNYRDVVQKKPLIAKQLKEYSLSTVFYDNFSDELISDLFIKILNNTNDLVPQEKNNATRSYFADFVRYTSRNGNGSWEDHKNMFHELFYRTVEDAGTDKEKTVWKYFAPKFKLGRMEGDNWLASLVYLFLNGLTNGVTPTLLSKFYKETAQTSGHERGYNFKEKLTTPKYKDLESVIIDLLNIGLEITKAGKKYKERLVPNFLLFAILFGNEMKDHYNSSSVDWNAYTQNLYKIWKDWSEPNKYMFDENGNPRKQYNGKTDMGPFKSLWGSPNPNVFNTAKQIVLEELEKNPVGWGFVELDPREAFPKEMIERRLAENGGIDDYTGESLLLADAVGDHDIPRSWGIALGGITEYENLKVTTAYHNKKKLNRNGEQYIQYLKDQGVI